MIGSESLAQAKIPCSKKTALHEGRKETSDVETQGIQMQASLIHLTGEQIRRTAARVPGPRSLRSPLAASFGSPVETFKALLNKEFVRAG